MGEKIFSCERVVHFICPSAVETVKDAAYSSSITASFPQRITIVAHPSVVRDAYLLHHFFA